MCLNLEVDVWPRVRSFTLSAVVRFLREEEEGTSAGKLREAAALTPLPPPGCRVQDAPRGPSPAPDRGSSPQTPVGGEQRVPVPKPAQQTRRALGEGTDRRSPRQKGGSGDSGKAAPIPARLTPGATGCRKGTSNRPRQASQVSLRLLGSPHTCDHVPDSE